MVLGCPTSARYITKYLLPKSSRPLCWEHFLGSLVKPVLLRETRCNLILRLKASSNTQARSAFSLNRVKLFQKAEKDQSQLFIFNKVQTMPRGKRSSLWYCGHHRLAQSVRLCITLISLTQHWITSLSWQGRMTTFLNSKQCQDPKACKGPEHTKNWQDHQRTPSPSKDWDIWIALLSCLLLFTEDTGGLKQAGQNRRLVAGQLCSSDTCFTLQKP